MPLTDYTFQLNSGPLLNDDSVGLPFVDITRVVGMDSAPYRESIRDHEGTDGSFIDAEFETGRDLAFEGTIYADVSNIETYCDELKANFAPVTSPIPLVLKAPGVAERVLFVKPRGVKYDWDTARRVGMSPVQLLVYAEDPRIYDNDLNNQVIPFGGSATTGFGFDLEFNLDFGVVVPPDGQYVVNNGNRPTPALLIIEGPVENPRIVNDTDSVTMEFIISLGADDTLTIDLGSRTVVLNDSINRRNTMVQPSWFMFRTGQTFLRFGGASGSGTLTVSYRNAWR